MNVPSILRDNEIELEALAVLLKNNSGAQSPKFRRPSSANEPISNVARERKKRHQKDARPRTTKERTLDALSVLTRMPLKADIRKAKTLQARVKKSMAAPITPNEELLLQKRKNALAKRRKRSVLRRKSLREIALRRGKRLPSCSCTLFNRNVRSSPPHAVWLATHKVLRRRCNFSIVRPRKALLTSPCCKAPRLLVAAERIGKVHRSLQRWTQHLTKVQGVTPKLPPSNFLLDLSHEFMYLVSPTTDKHRLSIQDVAAMVNLKATDNSCKGVLVEDDTDCEVVHGHMWSAARPAHVVPVTLLRLPPTKESRPSRFMCIAPSAVHFPSDVVSRVRLISQWNPCTTSSTFTSLFEIWSAGGISAENLRLTSVGTFNSTPPVESIGGKVITIAFPGLPLNPMTVRHGTLLTSCVWRIAYLVEGQPSTKCSDTLREYHFRNSRRLFSSLLTTLHQSDAVRAVLLQSKLHYRLRTSVLTRKERGELLHLLGRPVYPQDYTCQREERALPFTIALRGNLTNASLRVLCKSAAPNRRLSVLVSKRNSLLWRVEGLQDTKGSLVVSPLGMVTTEAPYYVQRFGCEVVLVWCFFVSSAGEIHAVSQTLKGESHKGTRFFLAPQNQFALVLKKSVEVNVFYDFLLNEACALVEPIPLHL
ncbi:hypothetical protein ADEAN_000530300 [Angomonas deanei]|uniref:Uncharacterized protein n=1 Tax=Angomonas deanei TaxID=59799 RepID=A0A7G2CDB1_9TRYP|nr:hypothetical protein ADEAN_000530300 [Angomonas deanei]